MRFLRVLAGLSFIGVIGFAGYQVWSGGTVADVVDLVRPNAALSDDDINELYLESRSEMIAGYQRGDNEIANAYDAWEPTATGPANPGVHSGRYMMTYVNDIGREDYVAYRSDNPSFPVGTKIAKESFAVKGERDFRAGPLFTMEKVAPGIADDTDGWVYDRVNALGRPMPTSQKFCHSCHQAFRTQDSLGYPAKKVRFGFVAASATGAAASVGAGDIKKGEAAFQNCASCHQVGAGAKNAFGPVLTDVVGRPAGSFTGYTYSPGLKAANEKGLIWDKQRLFEWLEDPSIFLQNYLGDEGARSKMPVGFDDPQMRNDIIAYLESLSGEMVMERKTHGDTPSASPREAMVSEPDQWDELPRERLELVAPPSLPKHSQKATGAIKIIEVELVVEEKKWTLDNKGTEIIGLTYNGSIPGPMIVAHQGDFVELTLKNPSTNLMEHNIDLHAATGALGGAALTTIVPGEEAVLRFEATKAGVFLYHCAPEGSMTPYHVTHGMTGAIMVLPRDGLKDGDGKELVYDKAYFIGENDFYVPKDDDGDYKKYERAGEDLTDWIESMHTLTPSHIVFNGRVGALTGEGAMTANVGDNVLFIHVQGNRDTRPHLIGGHGDYVWEKGAFGMPPARDLETWFIRGGSAGAALYEFKQPGVYAYLNHNLIEAVEFGAAAHVVVDGDWNERLMKRPYFGPIRENE